MRRHLPDDGSVRIHDVTSGLACFGVWGPRARDVLQPLTPADLSNEAFPYMTLQEITIGDVPLRALRVTYVGELGWELYCPTEYGARLWDTLAAAGHEHGLVPGGYRAIDALRLEKGYRAWGSDLSSETTPYEAGLGFAVKPAKGDFIGRDALDPAPAQRLVCLVLDDPRSIALGSEPVRAPDGDLVGRITSGGYGYAVDASIAFAYVPTAYAEPGTSLEVDIFGSWVPAEVRADPLIDPSGERIRA
jgi:glycine cleavage system aminomethyltransferase T